MGGGVERRLHLPVALSEVLGDRDDDAVAGPEIGVPGGAVSMVPTWHRAQPTESNRAEPFVASAVSARRASRGGALVARMNRAKWSMSVSPSGPGASSGSFTVSHRLVISVGSRRLVMPISLREASAWTSETHWA